MNTAKFKTAIMKPLILGMILFASCAPQQKVSLVTGGYTDDGTKLSERTVSKAFATNPKKAKTKRHPHKYYVKNKSFFGRTGINGQLQLYKY